MQRMRQKEMPTNGRQSLPNYSTAMKQEQFFYKIAQRKRGTEIILENFLPWGC